MKSKTRIRLSSAVEHALDRLEADFLVHDEQRFVLLLPTGFLPADCLDALGIPEAQPLHITWAFATIWFAADEPPNVTLTYCSHSAERQLSQNHLQARNKASPHDKFLHQVGHTVFSPFLQLLCITRHSYDGLGGTQTSCSILWRAGIHLKIVPSDAPSLHPLYNAVLF